MRKAPEIAYVPALGSGVIAWPSTGKVLWKTTLFAETYAGKLEPVLGEDVQWNIACVVEVQATEIIVKDTRKRTFRVSRATGALVATNDAPK